VIATATALQYATVESADGTSIAFASMGHGSGVIVLGGALQTGSDYLPLARSLARDFAVHVVDRRGRGASGPQGPSYSIANEIEDLLAVQRATRAIAVFGHSYGGLIALEAARRSEIFSCVVVYEPGVSVRGSIPVRWLPQYRELLASGDRRGAFAALVRGRGQAPGALDRLPLWYARLILRFAVRGRRWRRIEPLLDASLAEHEKVARLDSANANRYGAISAPVLVLAGGKSPPFASAEPVEALQRAIRNSEAEIIDGLDHLAPLEKAADVVATRAGCFLARTLRRQRGDAYVDQLRSTRMLLTGGFRSTASS
jgi:pimeloyl-ACP methyl ester carboxylesterase